MKNDEAESEEESESWEVISPRIYQSENRLSNSLNKNSEEMSDHTSDVYTITTKRVGHSSERDKLTK